MGFQRWHMWCRHTTHAICQKFGMTHFDIMYQAMPVGRSVNRHSPAHNCKTALLMGAQPRPKALTMHAVVLTGVKRSTICYGAIFTVTYIFFLTVRITEAFSLPKPSLFCNYKVMLLLCHLSVNWIQIQVRWYFSRHWLAVTNHSILLSNILAGRYFLLETLCHIMSHDGRSPSICLSYNIVGTKLLNKTSIHTPWGDIAAIFWLTLYDALRAKKSGSLTVSSCSASTDSQSTLATLNTCVKNKVK